MKLRKLEIELQRWGDNEGKYLGSLHFEDERKTEVKLELSPEQADKFVSFSAPILMAAANNAAEQFKTKLIAALPQVHQLA